jgi:large subunit ribosomal protein L9
MQIILLERIAKLGQMGDVVTVKDGFARNFLLPQGKALRANKSNKEIFDRDRAQLEARNLEAKSEAEGVAVKLNGQSFIIIRQAGDTGQLYGSVSTRDIAEKISEDGFSIDRRQVLIDRPIKALGLQEMNVSLHPEVEAGVIINVARSEDEAARQARGEDINAYDDDDDDVEDEELSAEDVFEEGAQGPDDGEDGETDADAGTEEEAAS